MNVSKIANTALAARNFNGHWGKVMTVAAPYPYDEATQEVRYYFPDRDESIDKINEAYVKQTGGRTIGSYPYPAYGYSETYRMGGINYLIADKRSWELRKAHLSGIADKAEKAGKYADAIRCKIRIANILAKQGKLRDQYLVEQGMREAYGKIPSYERSEIQEELLEYNPDLLFDLAKKNGDSLGYPY